MRMPAPSGTGMSRQQAMDHEGLTLRPYQAQDAAASAGALGAFASSGKVG